MNKANAKFQLLINTVEIVLEMDGIPLELRESLVKSMKFKRAI